MPFKRVRAKLVLSVLEQEELTTVSHSRNEPVSRVQRAQMLLAYASDETISSIARRLRTNRPKVERCVDKALQLGVQAAMKDLPRAGRKAQITAEARTWVVNLACQKPKELGYSYEIWTRPTCWRAMPDATAKAPAMRAC
jgi:hypothetical protein